MKRNLRTFNRAFLIKRNVCQAKKVLYAMQITLGIQSFQHLNSVNILRLQIYLL